MKVLLTSTFILMAVALGAQDGKNSEKSGKALDFSLQLERQSSGSGHHNFSSLGGSFRLDRVSVHVGAILGDRAYRFNGVKMNVRYFPIDFGAKVRPYFQYDLLTRWNARLTPELERLVHGEGWNGQHHENYRTMEHYLGFGAKTPVIQGFYVDLGIGLGLYHSRIRSARDERIKDPERFRSRMDASLSLSAGIGYDL